MSLLDRLNNLISSHTYYYVDDGKIKNKELNFFQKILRKFGYFEETHLRPLVERAYRISLRGNLKASQDEQKLLQLIYKANKTYNYHFKLGEFISPGKYFLKATIQYQITKISASDTYKVSALRLFDGHSKFEGRDVHMLDIFKQLDRSVIEVSYWFARWRESDFIHNILQKILLDQPEVDAEFHYYCPKVKKIKSLFNVYGSNFITSPVPATWELADRKKIIKHLPYSSYSVKMEDYVMKKEALRENGNYHTWEDKHAYSLNHALDLITPGNFKFPETRV
jgi:hypothetical protein